MILYVYFFFEPISRNYASGISSENDLWCGIIKIAVDKSQNSPIDIDIPLLNLILKNHNTGRAFCICDKSVLSSIYFASMKMQCTCSTFVYDYTVFTVFYDASCKLYRIGYPFYNR